MMFVNTFIMFLFKNILVNAVIYIPYSNKGGGNFNRSKFIKLDNHKL
jgi:hypothetical protein